MPVSSSALSTRQPPGYTHIVDQSEDVVEHIVASISIRQQLECLCVVHRPLLFVNQ